MKLAIATVTDLLGLIDRGIVSTSEARLMLGLTATTVAPPPPPRDPAKRSVP